MFNTFKAIKGILKRKNSLICAERERAEAAECANRILSAYISVLVSETGKVSVPRSVISSALGKYVSEVSANDTDYIISVKEDRSDILGKREKRV